jgi:hypothetical protein
MTLFLWVQPKIKIGGNNATEHCGTHRGVVAVVRTLGGVVIGQIMTRESRPNAYDKPTFRAGGYLFKTGIMAKWNRD